MARIKFNQMRNTTLFHSGLLQFVILLSIFSCSTERMQILDKAEKILPGNWKIESVQLPRDHNGVTYQGITFFTDTILYDVGSLELAEFSADTLSHEGDGKVSCNVSIGADHFPFSLNFLTISGENIFTRFQYNGAHGIHYPNTPGEEFIWSSLIFNNNYVITIINNNLVELAKANEQHDNVITLRRE